MNKFEQIIKFNTESIGVQSCLKFVDILNIKMCSKQLNTMKILPFGTLIYRGDFKLMKRVKDQINKIVFAHYVSTSTIIKDVLKICPYIKEIKISRMSIIDFSDEGIIYDGVLCITYNKSILERELNEHLKNIKIIACNCYVSDSLLNNEKIIYILKCSKCGNKDIDYVRNSMKYSITKEVLCSTCQYINKTSKYSRRDGLLSLVACGKSDEILMGKKKILYPKHKKENFVSKYNKKIK